MSKMLCGRAVLAIGWFATTLVSALPPNAPTINEPVANGQVVNPADVHMETAPFADPDPGDAHFCTDWEIWSVTPVERVWSTLCITGLEAVHTHLGDGVFSGSHAGRTELFYDNDYRLQVRHRDDSAPGGGEWSAWSERTFVTGPPTEIFPLELDDLAVAPAPTWIDISGQPVVLAGATVAPGVFVESATGGLLLALQGFDGTTNAVTNPPALPFHTPTRIRISAGGLSPGLVLPESDLSFTDHDGAMHTVYLPSVSVGLGSDAYFWVSAVGATYVGSSTQTQPDFSTLARGIPVPWQMHQPGYRVEIVASGFRLPVNIAFVPNPGIGPDAPLYYVTELYGTIKVVTQSGTVTDYATNLLNFSPTGLFPGSGEQGLTGIVVEPSSGDVFAAFLADAGGPHYPRVVRFSSTDGGLTASQQNVILNMVGESQGQSHQISNLSLGPDGKLYVHMGDGFDAGTAQNLNSFRGKILRLELDGTAPVDNPFYDAGNGINAADYVYAYGLRNPFGGAWRAADGALYEVENGPSIDRFAKISPGQNYLWNGSDNSMTNFAILNWAPAVGPTNIAFIQGATFGGSLFPADKQGHAFIADSGPTWATGAQSNGKQIREYVLSPTGTLISGPTPFVSYVGNGKATAVALAAGPDGLYFSDFYADQDFASPTAVGSHILRIKYVGAVDFAASVTSGLAPLNVQFTDLSTVPVATAWEWSFGDGSMSALQNPSHVYAQDGIYDVTLRVSGANGLVATQKVAFVRVGDFPLVGMIGGSLPPTPADEAFADHLRARGLEVLAYDDEPANRPSAAALAATHDLVIVSSTVTSANVGAEFRDEAVPLLFWESALLRPDREPLANAGAVAFGANAIEVTVAPHPITQGLVTGIPQAVFTTAANMSVGVSPFPIGATVLASRAGVPAEAAVLVADSGAPLFGGHAAPARRVFLFLEDSTWLQVTPVARDLIDRAVDWALGTIVGNADFLRGDCNADGGRDISDAIFLLNATFAAGSTPPCMDACDGNDDGASNIADVITILGFLFSSGPLPPPSSCGSDPTADALGCAQSACP
ncbi:MAG: PQQ-dependent sugar dehydrogenase [Planctomycetota bacterium]